MSIAQPLLAPEMHALIVERDEARAELERARAGVTVCVPCFNQAEHLDTSLGSVLAQTVSAFEVLVIDDGSNAEQAAVIAQTCRVLQHRVPTVPIRCLRITNRGLVGARNTGLMLARTFAFLPLDADDWLDARYLEKTLPLLADADVVLTGIQEHGQRNGTYPPGFDRPWINVSADLILNDYNRFYYCSLARTDVLRLAGGYNAKMSEGLEDADLWVDLLERGMRFAAVAEPLFNYRTGAGMLQTIHQNGGYQRMVTEMHRHHR